MAYHQKSLDEHLANDGKPKRILSIDGGGLKGVSSLGILQKIEDLLRKRHNNSDAFCLGHYFDLIAGTSTGAVIAATLATGMRVSEVLEKYMNLGHLVFEKSFFRKGILRAKYQEEKLNKELQNVFGAKTQLGGPEVQTGLLLMTKRLDTGSPWPISNNPQGKYYEPRPGESLEIIPALAGGSCLHRGPFLFQSGNDKDR